MTVKKPTVALAMIVRNSSATIDKLLESVKGHFDEYVFVDTGSEDDTREKIAKAFSLVSKAAWRFPVEGGPFHGDNHYRYEGCYDTFDVGGPAPAADVVLARFDWIRDFAAARTFAFSLASSDWVMWLDADDVLENGELVRPVVADADAHGSNVIIAPYRVEPRLRVARRVMKRSAGWRWKNPVHEDVYFEPAEGEAQARTNAFAAVTKAKEGDALLASLARNREILLGCLNAAKISENWEQIGWASWYLCNDALSCGEGSWIGYARDAAAFAPTDLRAYASVVIAANTFTGKPTREQFELAERASQWLPNYAEAWALRIMLHYSGGQVRQALALVPQFKMVLDSDESNFINDRDAVLVAVGRCYAAAALYSGGKTEEAGEMLEEISNDLRAHMNVANFFNTMSAKLAAGAK